MEQYLEMFTDEFADFIEEVKIVAEDLDRRYDKKFTKMFEEKSFDEHDGPITLIIFIKTIDRSPNIHLI